MYVHVRMCTQHHYACCNHACMSIRVCYVCPCMFMRLVAAHTDVRLPMCMHVDVCMCEYACTCRIRLNDVCIDVCIHACACMYMCMCSHRHS